jgi:glycosyltransferase involved in cell wall biosynthesis
VLPVVEKPFKNDKIRVLIDARISDSEYGGIRTYSQLLLENTLKMDGLEVYALTNSESRWLNEFLPEAQVIRLKADERSLYQSLRRFPLIAAFLRSLYYLTQRRSRDLSDLVPRGRVDIFHSAIQDAPLMPAKMVYHPHDLQHLVLPHNFDLPTRIHRNRIWRAIAARADAIIVGSNSVKDEISKFWPESLAKVTVVPVPPPAKVSKPRDSSKWPNSILYVAGLYPHKNQETLITAYASLPESLRVAHPLVLVGTGPDRARLEKLSRSKGEQLNVVFTGAVNDDSYKALLKESSLVCVPSRYEAGSFPILEALQAGIPVVASDIPAFKDIFPGCVDSYGEPDDDASLGRSLTRNLNGELGGQSANAINEYLSSIDERNFRNSLLEIYVGLIKD